MEKSPERLKAEERMTELEMLGEFDKDVEDDPKSSELLPEDIDYLHKKLKTKILSALTIRAGGKFFRNQQKTGNLIIKEIVGTENLKNLKGGAIVTCNHIHPFDNYIILQAIKPCLKKNGRFFKVIKEGNYTNPPKGFEMFMKYGDTLPLSSNHKTMRKFLESVSVLLSKNKKILIYPEQSMWWNYRKPRPLKNGAFSIAISNNVPVIPLFITMEDTEKIGDDGYPIQAYTVFVHSPIYPQKDIPKNENILKMKNENYDLWKKTYEKFYNTPLVYKTKEN